MVRVPVLSVQRTSISGGSALGAGSEETKVLELDRRARIGSLLRIELFDWHRLARKARLDKKEVFAADEPHVSRNHVARRQLHDVSRHDLRQRYFARIPFPNDRGAVTRIIARSLAAAAGARRPHFLEQRVNLRRRYGQGLFRGGNGRSISF
jgi:hypothetical protein